MNKRIIGLLLAICFGVGIGYGNINDCIFETMSEKREKNNFHANPITLAEAKKLIQNIKTSDPFKPTYYYIYLHMLLRSNECMENQTIQQFIEKYFSSLFSSQPPYCCFREEKLENLTLCLKAKAEKNIPTLVTYIETMLLIYIEKIEKDSNEIKEIPIYSCFDFREFLSFIIDSDICMQSSKIKIFLEYFFATLFSRFSSDAQFNLIYTCKHSKHWTEIRSLKNRLLLQYKNSMDQGRWLLDLLHYSVINTQKIDPDLTKALSVFIEQQFDKIPDRGYFAASTKASFLYELLISGATKNDAALENLFYQKIKLLKNSHLYEIAQKLVLEQAIYNAKISIQDLNLECSKKHDLIHIDDVRFCAEPFYNNAFGEKDRSIVGIFYNSDYITEMAEYLKLSGTEAHIKKFIEYFKQNGFSELPKDLQDEFKQLAETVGMW